MALQSRHRGEGGRAEEGAEENEVQDQGRGGATGKWRRGDGKGESGEGEGQRKSAQRARRAARMWRTSKRGWRER